jgi:hypothetical protein
VASEASVAAKRSKKARGGGDQERAQPALRRCNEVAFPRYSYSYDRTQARLDSDRVRISSGLALTQLSLLRVFKQAVLWM